MSSGNEQERLEEEIAELRAELGETVEALVHKIDVPARAKERAGELTDEARERVNEITQEAVERGNAVKDRAVEVLGQARAKAGKMPGGRWAMIASTGAALISLAVIVRRVRSR